MTAIGFDEKIETRLRHEELARMDELIKAHPDRWENRSHFVRSAVINFINGQDKWKD